MGRIREVEILAMQQVLNSVRILVSDEVNVARMRKGFISVNFGRNSGNNPAEGIILVEASSRAQGDGFWFPLVAFSMTPDDPNSTQLDGAVAVGDTSLTVDDTTGFAVGDIVSIDPASGGSAAEQCRVIAVPDGTTLTIQDPLILSHTDGRWVHTEARLYSAILDFRAVARLRVVANPDEAYNQHYVISAHLSGSE